MCDGLGRQFSYSCPNATLFQQRMLICDHWYMVNCNQSEEEYAANLRIGQKDKLFVEESEQETYQRTPRPDLISNNYRSGRSQYMSNLNLVGSEFDEKDKNNTDTKQVLYFLPSHWFTEYSENATKEKLKEKFTSLNQNKIPKNNESSNNKKADDNYKTKSKMAQKVINILKRKTGFSTETPTNFKRNPIGEFNRNSQPPKVNTLQPNPLSKDVEVHNSRNNVNNNFITSTSTQPNKPNLSLQNDEYHWKSLRNFYLIPDYEFPLDPIARPGYDNGHASSFDVESRSKL